MERDCPYNRAIVCDSEECYHCGWDPEVTERRIEKFKEELVEEKSL